MNIKKKRLTIQLAKNEEWLLDKAHKLAAVRSLSLRELVIETLATRIEKERSVIEGFDRLKREVGK